MFAFYEKQPDPSRIRRLQEIGFLSSEHKIYGPHVLWQLGTNSCFTGNATILFNISSSILEKSNYLLSLAPEEYPLIEACRARSGTCVLNVVDRLLRGQYSSLYPSLYDSGWLRYIFESIIMLVNDLSRLISNESASIESQEACQFMKRYLSESTKLIERRCTSSLFSPALVRKMPGPESTPLYNVQMFVDEKTEDRLQKVLVLFDLHQPTMKLQRLTMIVPYAWLRTECHYLPPIFTFEDFSYALMTVSEISGPPSDLLELLNRSVNVCAKINVFLSTLGEGFVSTTVKIRKNRNDSFLQELTCLIRKIDATTVVPGSIRSVAQRFAQSWAPKIDGLKIGRGPAHSPGPQHTWATFVASAFRCLLPMVFRIFSMLSTDQMILALHVLREGAAFEAGASYFLGHPYGQKFLHVVECHEPIKIEEKEE